MVPVLARLRVRLSACLAPGLLAAACSRGAPPRRPGEEVLAAIAFEGNAQLHDDELRAGLALRRTLRRGRAPDPYTVDTDAARIKGQYLRRGYLDVDVRARVERRDDETTVIYAIDEGPRARTRFAIAGLPPELPAAKVRALIPLREGDPFDYAAYDEAKEALELVIKDVGYAHAELDAKIVADRASNTATIQLDYEPGPRSTFDRTTIVGVTGELRDAVAARLRFRPGQVYSASALLNSQRALYAMGRFSTVQITPDAPAPTDPTVEVRVDVAQGARRELRLGGGFGVDPAVYEVRGRAGYSVAGWLMPLNTLTLDLRPAYALLRDGTDAEPRLRAVARVDRADLLWTYSRGEVEAAYSYVAFEAYTSYGPRVRLGLSSPIGDDRLQVGVGWSLHNLDFRNLHPLVDPMLARDLGLDRTERVGALQQSVQLDLRDDPLDTKLGAYAEVRVAEGAAVAGGGYDFVEIVPELRGYAPLGARRSWRTPVLGARLRLGGIFGDLPPSERLFAGGAASHRGFGERELAPAAIGEHDGDLRSIPYGGAALLLASLEARVPVTTWREMPVGVVAFLDGGDVTERVRDLDVDDLHWAAGGGLRLDTIVGPVRADLGYRLNRKGGTNPEPRSSLAFHLSLGEAF